MMIYLCVRRLCAIHCHISMVYGPWPIFNVYTFQGEAIMEFPYMEIIITPWKKILAERHSLKHLELYIHDKTGTPNDPT